MNKFDELYQKLISECKCSKEETIETEVNSDKIVTEEENIEAAYNEKVTELFKKVLADEACDLAELIFKDENEKTAYIDNAVNEYIDDIQEHIEGEIEPKEFMVLADDVKLEKVKAAIADNSEAIFGKDIFA
jgi:hypothetical protein